MAIGGLSKKVLELFEIPIPGLDEQKRVVARVNELLELCERLTSRIASAKKLQQKIGEVIVNQAMV